MTDKKTRLKTIATTIGIVLVIILLKFALFGQTETLYHENGQKAKERTFNFNGDIISSTHWYENGQIKEETKWKDSKAEGAYTEWYTSGQKKVEGVYKSGKPNTVIVWKPNGLQCAETNLKNGSGVKVEYYENGDKKEKQVWLEGQQTGEWIKWKIKGGNWLINNPREMYGSDKENGYTIFRETYKEGKSVARSIWREQQGIWEAY